MSHLIEELKKRNVLRTGAAYLVVSWFVLQFVEVVFPMLGLDGEVLGRKILIVLLVGLPVTLFLSWVFEITPQGIKRESDIDRNKEVIRGSSRNMDRVIIVILTIAIALLLVDRFVLDQPAETSFVADDGSMSSIAVLPFVNLSDQSDTGFFADGLTESLLHQLAEIPELRVPSRTSVFSFRDKQMDIRDIAQSLNVETVLEGSVQRSGNRIRISAVLIQADSGLRLWSKNFDKTMDDIFAVQDEIAASVASAMKVTLIGGDQEFFPQVATASTLAYEAYLQGLEQKNIASYASLPQAEGLFKEALAIDPNFSDAKIDLALTYNLQAETGLLTPDEASTRSRPLLEQVLAIDSDNPRAQAHLAVADWLAAVRSLGPVNPVTENALQTMQDTLETAPNETALHAALSTASLIAGDNDEGIRWLERGLDVDPLSARLLLQKGRVLLNIFGEPEEAARAFEKGRQSAPDWTAVNFASGDAAFAMGDFADGIRWYGRAMMMDPRDHELPGNIGRFMYGFGMDEEADEMLERATAIAPDAPWTRGLLLAKHIRAENHERVAQLAAGILADDIEDRGSAFSLSIFAYVSSMIELGRIDEVPAFFEQIRPGITEVNYQPPGIREFSLRFGLLHALISLERFDEAEIVGEAIETYADLMSPGWREDPYLMFNMELAKGNIDAAIEHAVSDLSQDLGNILMWRFNYQHLAWVKPILTDSRISPLIERKEEESAKASAEIREMMAREWLSPQASASGRSR